MTTKFDLITRASLKLDANQVSSFEEKTREVEIFQPLYEPAKRAELSGFQWNFSKFTVKLTQEIGDPINKSWNYKWLEPTDMLVLVNVIDDTGYSVHYVHEQERIFTVADGPLYAQFMADVAENSMPWYFQDLLVARLKWEAAEPLSGDRNVVATAKEELKDARKEAKRADTKQNPARPIIANQSRYLKAFFSGTRYNRFKPFGS